MININVQQPSPVQVSIAGAANRQFQSLTEAGRAQITPLEGEPIYATDSKRLYVGDGSTAGGNEVGRGGTASQVNPPGMARLVTIRNSGTFSINIKTTTGYAAVRWWDDSVEVFGSGAAASDIVVSKAIPATGNWIKSAPKEIFVWSCTSANANQSGNLTSLFASNDFLVSLDVRGLSSLVILACSNNSLTSLDVSGCTALGTLYCTGNSLTSLDVSGLTALNTLACQSNSLTSLDVSGCVSLTDLSCENNSLTSLDVSGFTSLSTLYCSNNSLTSLDVGGLTALTALYCGGNLLTSLDVSGCVSLAVLNCIENSLTSLDVSGLTSLSDLFCYNNSLTSLDASGCTALVYLNCFNNSLTSLDVSGLTALENLACGNNSLTSLDVSGLTSLNNLFCEGNSLTSLRASGVSLGGFVSSWSSYYGGGLSDNQLSAAALNQFYTDLAPSPGHLQVSGNPGTAGDDPTIATAKGYTVYGS